MSLKGKVAVITGSTSGIGYGAAQALAAQGCNIVLNGLGDEATVLPLQEELKDAYGVEVIYHPANLERPGEIKDLIESSVASMGSIDILLNNAGIQHVDPIEKFPVDTWDRIIAVNLTAAFHTIRLSLPHMRKAGWGRIINTCSVHSLVASPNKSAYTAAKHGMAGLTKAVALEVAGQGITANGFCPGWTRTPILTEQIAHRAKHLGVSLEEGARDLLREKQPSQQFVEIDHLAQLVIFLCSDAASQMTGSILTMDGGWTVQ